MAGLRLLAVGLWLRVLSVGLLSALLRMLAPGRSSSLLAAGLLYPAAARCRAAAALGMAVGRRLWLLTSGLRLLAAWPSSWGMFPNQPSSESGTGGGGEEGCTPLQITFKF